MLVSLTVGKIDAGVCVLLTEDKRLIEFPSILLPPDITSGSIVDVDVSRNFEAEQRGEKAFQALQSTILSTFGSEEPLAPVLRCRNATQTSVVLEWDPISLAMANLRSLSLYRDGTKIGNIPKPLEMTSTKISGLAVDREYNFHLILRTSAGIFSSEKLVVRTHKMTDLSGITVTPGVMAPQLRTSLEGTIEKIGAKLIEQVRIDTTHFVCTEEKGAAYERAKEMNIPIVVPDWIKGCEREGRLVGVRGYYLNADPKLRQVGPIVVLSRESSQQTVPQAAAGTSTPERDSIQQTPTTNIIPPTPERRPRESDENEQDDNSTVDSTEEEPANETEPQQTPEDLNGDKAAGSIGLPEATSPPDHAVVDGNMRVSPTEDVDEAEESEEAEHENGIPEHSEKLATETPADIEKKSENFDEVDLQET